MEKLLPLACFIALAVANQPEALDIDRGNCVDVSSGFGQDASCPVGFVAVGACSSGSDPDCEGTYNILSCCESSAVVSEMQMACSQVDGGFGEEIYCNQGMQVNAMCGSGSDPDCGPDTYTRIMCCDDNAITTGPGSICRKMYADFGQLIKCSSNEVMVGFCGSGSDPDCNGSYTMIACCSYT